MELEFSLLIFEKCWNIKFNVLSFVGRVLCRRMDKQRHRQTDMMKLIVAFAILRTRLIKI